MIFKKIKNLLSRETVENFHKLYYDSRSQTWENTSWLGVPIWKCPLDLWVYQEIIHDVRPDIIIESGTAHGGSALFLASMCDLMNKGKVVTIDIANTPYGKDSDNPARPQHSRIKYLIGSSTSEDIVEEIRKMVGDRDRVLVILDSDHSMKHVVSELEIYSKFVTKGSYMIVEDTNINGHPVCREFGPGPMEAIDKFLADNKNFVVDKNKEKFFMTFNPKGYLCRVL